MQFIPSNVYRKLYTYNDIRTKSCMSHYRWSPIEKGDLTLFHMVCVCVCGGGGGDSICPQTVFLKFINAVKDAREAKNLVRSIKT